MTLKDKILLLLFGLVVLVAARTAWIAAVGDPFFEHAACIGWNRPLLYWQVANHALIFAAYVALSLTLVFYSRKRGGDEWPKWVSWAFATFIVFCGVGHLVAMITYFVPIYWTEAIVNTGTVIASVITATGFPFAFRNLMAQPSRADMQKLIDDLQEAKTEVVAAEAAKTIDAGILHGMHLRLDALIARADALQNRFPLEQE